jgi:putrescine importer
LKLKTADLIIYGLVLIQPIAPVGIFGIANVLSQGHVTASILLAMVAMMLTALSYGRLAALYPSSGSAYSYVSGAFNPIAGYVVGWAMFLDYLIIPIVSSIYAALTLHRLFEGVPFWLWVSLVIGLAVLLNLGGISSLARANKALLAVMTVIIAAFLYLAAHFLYSAHGWHGLISVKPIYDPATFDLHAITTATSLAALTYIGFDGVTTLAEEADNPRRSVPLATVSVCLLTGLLSALEVYLAQLAWPDYRGYPNNETAFLDVTRLVGGPALFTAMGVILVVACFGTALTSLAGAARLLGGMARDNVLPARWFAGHTARNIVFLGVVTLIGALCLSYEQAAELINYGAFLAFMGVNLACMRVFVPRSRKWAQKLLLDTCIPLSGFLFCFLIWWALPRPAKIAGTIWLAAGALQLIFRGGITHTAELPMDQPSRRGA